MRIGIWCDYGFTLGPTEGIGVFVDNLARGLVRANSDCEVCLMAHLGDHHLLDSTVAGGLGRIQVETGIRQTKIRRKVARAIKKVPWLGNLSSQLTREATKKTEDVIQSCDVWLVPYVGLDQEFSKPTVVVIHDLVTYHFPEMLKPRKLQRLKNRVNRIVRQSRIAACMSNFIRDHDLIGTLGLPEDRIRVIRGAVPDDISDAKRVDSDTATQWLLKNKISEPYLFYPAAFRSYKNHRFLVDSLHLLKKQSSTPWKVVFTGIKSCPQELDRQICSLDLQNDVIMLGKVSRAELTLLYQHAFATVVPTLYEQGSFPILEALAFRCPIASSDIPPLREQLSLMDSNMLFFDPHDPRTLLPIMEHIQQNRQAVIETQSSAFDRMREHTWDSAAIQWLDLFHETLRMESPIGTFPPMRQSA
jgi:glycosyltransferase involved in cell wall biosynthesis